MSRRASIVVGISGGVDSAVAAYLLKNQGYDVHGIFMQNWEADQDDPYCTATEDLHDAEQVCKQIDIPFSRVNFSNEYWQRVFSYFLDEYAAGRTPNPDVLCNREIKFKAFLDHALELGADYIATGHYVGKRDNGGRFELLRGIDRNKDQSYFLYTLTQHQLKHSLFPLGDLTKSEVRDIARKTKLPNHAKKDSTGICFIGERNFKQFLSEYLLNIPGDIVTTEGDVIGKHDGIMFYTLGQRKGLGIGGQQNCEEKGWYVVAKDIEKNQLTVTQNHDHPALLSSNLKCKDAHWISNLSPELPYSCTAKVRYRVADANCRINKLLEDNYDVEFEDQQWAVTPGQALVFYQNEVCLGGATIC